MDQNVVARIVFELVTVLAVGFVSGAICKRIGVSMLAGYLLGGVVLGSVVLKTHQDISWGVGSPRRTNLEKFNGSEDVLLRVLQVIGVGHLRRNLVHHEFAPDRLRTQRWQVTVRSVPTESAPQLPLFGSYERTR